MFDFVLHYKIKHRRFVAQAMQRKKESAVVDKESQKTCLSSISCSKIV